MRGGLPEGLSSSPEYLAAQRDATEEHRHNLHEEQLSRLEYTETIERPRNPTEAIALIRDMSLAQMRERNLEQKYGTGLMARWRRFMAGEHDVSYDDQGNVRHHAWRELGRHALKGVFNKRTALGVGALAVVGFLSGGAGLPLMPLMANAGLPAIGSFWGNLAGRMGGELWRGLSGEERNVRAKMLEIEKERYLKMRLLADTYHHPDTDSTKKPAILEQIIDQYTGASQDELGKRLLEAGTELRQVQKRQDKIRKNLELWGSLVGLGGGFLAAESALAGGLEGGRTAFGKIDTDASVFKHLGEINWQDQFHSVYQTNETWNFAYNHPTEAAGALIKGAKVLNESAGFGHVFGDSAWKIYAYAAVKALPVLAALNIGQPVGLAARRGEQKLEADYVASRASERRQLRENIEGTQPVPERVALEGTAREGDVTAFIGLHPGRPEGYIVTLDPSRSQPPRESPWDPKWLFARVESVVINPTDSKQEVKLQFFQSEDDLRAGRQFDDAVVSGDEYLRLRSIASGLLPERPLNPDEQKRLRDPEFAKYYNRGLKQELELVKSPGANALRIVVDQHGWPQPVALNPKDRYELSSVDLEKNIGQLHNKTRGESVYVDLVRLQPLINSFILPPTKEADEKKPVSSPEIMELRRDILSREDVEPERNTFWVLPRGISLEGIIKEGSNKGEEKPLRSGTYQVTNYDMKKGAVTVRPLVIAGGPAAEAVEVSLEDFARAMQAEWRRISEIFRDKEAAGDPVPDEVTYPEGPRREIQRNQEYTYRFPGDPGPLPYRVVSLANGQAQVRQLTGLTVAGGAPIGFAAGSRNQPVLLAELAEHGVFNPI